MTATVKIVKREVDGEGDAFHTLEDASTPTKRLTQMMALNPEFQGCLLTNDRTNATPVDQETIVATANALFFRVDGILKDPAPAGDRWLMVFDKAIPVVNTDLPILRSPKITGDFASIDLGLYGLQAALGLVVAFSTTPDSLTLSTAGDGFFQYAYALPAT